MYNLNVNLAAQAAINSLSVMENCGGGGGGTSVTPRTPEILNSLIAMTNPMDSYQYDGTASIQSVKLRSSVFDNDGFNRPHHPQSQHHSIMSSTSSGSSDSNSSSSSQLESPIANNPPSIQHTCSQLIKAGLKLSIEQKRKQYVENEDLLDLDSCGNKRVRAGFSTNSNNNNNNECSESEEDPFQMQQNNGLTQEDEERRRRRRERNKIAATKCRLKKRERTANLINESETLEVQNVDLKGQLHELQNQKRSLLDLLSHHRPHCQQGILPPTREDLYRIPSLTNVTVNAAAPNYNTTTTANNKTSNNSTNNNNVNISNKNNSNTIRPNNTISNGNHHHPHHHNRPQDPNQSSGYRIIGTTSYPNGRGGGNTVGGGTYQPHITNLDTNYYYNSQCHHNLHHNNNNNQNYSSTSTGLDNGCMA